MPKYKNRAVLWILIFSIVAVLYFKNEWTEFVTQSFERIESLDTQATQKARIKETDGWPTWPSYTICWAPWEWTSEEYCENSWCNECYHGAVEWETWICWRCEHEQYNSCGNGIVEEWEECDYSEFNWIQCPTVEYWCNFDCSFWITVGYITVVDSNWYEPTCWDEILNEWEECEYWWRSEVCQYFLWDSDIRYGWFEWMEPWTFCGDDCEVIEEYSCVWGWQECDSAEDCSYLYVWEFQQPKEMLLDWISCVDNKCLCP